MDQYVLNPEDLEDICSPLMAREDVSAKMKEFGEADFSYQLPGVCRFRVNLFRQQGHLAFVMRQLPLSIPDPGPLGIPQAVINLTTLKRGLVLITGATGSGKSTTLAALLGIINSNYKKHIITVEDPIEYVHTHKQSEVNQREVGVDTKSFANALRAMLREDPDVILVGEMRDAETIEIALTAAETGHLVFSTLHTNSAPATIDRIIDVFPANKQDQIRTQLANVIEGICCQQLLKKREGKGRIAAHEVMLATPAIRNLIREGKTFQMASQIQTNKKLGMQTMDDCLYSMYIQNKISAEDCIRYAQNYTDMAQKVQSF
jgi:twitching motility protein PilT